MSGHTRQEEEQGGPAVFLPVRGGVDALKGSCCLLVPFSPVVCLPISYTAQELLSCMPCLLHHT